MKKNFTKTLIVCALFVAFFNLTAQEANVLKAFINKNELAVRSVQKYSINLTDQASELNVKELLKLQIASVKLFGTNPGKSADISYLVRTKCTDFLNQNSKGSIEYLKLSDKEKLFFSSPKPVDKTDSHLNKSELQKINSIDVKNPHLFDDLTIRIK